MAVQVRLSAPSKTELEESIRLLGAAFSPTSPVREGHKGDWLCYGVFVQPDKPGRGTRKGGGTDAKVD
jgi:hypothetical protein